MQLLIEIPEEKYNTIKNKMYCGIYDAEVYESIANGTPISDNEPKTGHWIDAIEPIPVEKRDVKLGFNYKNAGYKCSECGATHEEHRLSMIATKTNYCPNCGAKMTESEG